VIRNDLIHILRDVSEEILNAKDVYKLAKAAHQIVERFVPVPYSGIYLWIPSENRIRLLYAIGFTDEENETNERTAMERHPGQVFKSREILYVKDMHTEKLPEFVKDNNRKKVVRSRLWMPICTENRSLGSFGFASEKPNFFTQEHQDVLEYICRLVANQYVKMIQAEAEAEFARKLNEAYTKVNEAFKVQSQFTAKMNHELRTPLNSILGLLRILEQSQLTGDQQSYLTMIREQSQVLLSLVNDVLDISKIQDNEFRVVAFDLDLKVLIDDVARVMRLNAQAKGIELDVFYASDIPTFIKSDELRLRQILNNILSNAVKFTEKGKVSLFVKKLSGVDGIEQIQFEISDTGIGIAQEKVDHVFDRFYQVSDEVEIKYGGSGLGLTIVKEIVDRMNGEITVSSIEGKGTTFTVKIPLHEASGMSAENKEIEDAYNLDGKRILIVDDNAINVHYLSHILKEKNALVESAEDGEKAIQLLTNDSDFDLILMDIRMPKMDGILCTKEIREKLKLEIPIIVQSGNTIERDIELCYTAGATDFISKPIDEKELFRKATKLSLHNPDRNTTKYSTVIELNETLQQLFVVSIEEFTFSINESLTSKDASKIQFELHKIKSSLHQLGYESLSKTAGILENKLQSGITLDKIQLQLNTFLKEISEIHTFLKKEGKL
jgi:signal transduction histidine kinase/DNA-binding response OmpR family regulator